MSALPGDMNLLRQRAQRSGAAPRPARPAAAVQAARAGLCPSRAGTAPGINISPGSDDDGWVVPQPVTLSDGTRIQLYKDGEALHAGLEAIRDARRRICLEVYIFADDDTGHAFADAPLPRRRGTGLRVFVIYDSFGSRGIGGREPEMFRECAATASGSSSFTRCGRGNASSVGGPPTATTASSCWWTTTSPAWAG